MNPRFLIGSFALIIGLLVGWLLIDTPPQDKVENAKPKIVKNTNEPVAPDPKSDRERTQSSDRDPDFDPNAIPYERIIAFSNEEDYRNFLRKLANSKVKNLGQIDGLFAVRFGFNHRKDFDALGLDPDQLEFNYPVTVPELREIEPQEGLVGFGTTALEFLGITTDNSAWGEGVRVAVIDTGIESHLALSDNVQHINLVEPSEGELPNGHGTAVASLIAGTHPNMRGVAPSVDLISVRVVDESGSSSSFLLAEGIIAAVDSGAHLINISLGSEGDSALVRRAVEYATSQGSVIFASSGNSGLDNASYPAAYENVYAVGAVDARGEHLNFSNADPNLAFTAPGYEVRAAVPGDNVTSFTGTSGAVTFPLSATAAIMSEENVSALVAVGILNDYTNEAGAPGADPQYGNGILDVGRALNRNTAGIVDVAAASQFYLFPEANNRGSGVLQVSVENRGTEAVYQSSLEVNIAGDQYNVPIQALQPNERKVIDIPAGYGVLLQEGQLDVGSRINLSGRAADTKPGNNQREDTILLPDNGS